MNNSQLQQHQTTQLWGHPRETPKQFFQSMNEMTSSMENFDFYGKGEGLENFENKIAKLLSKEEAVFMPSGTMAQQIAIRVWSDLNQNHQVAYHPLSHLEIHEKEGIYQLHPQLQIKLLANRERLITLKDIQGANLKGGILLLELPQRELGGVLPSWTELTEISNWCRANQVTLHLDGARLWECTPYYKKSPTEIAALFDSVYVSFYKGLGAIAGAMLISNKKVIDNSRVWLRRYGGNLISLYPYYLSANFAYEKRISKMQSYHQKAIEIAALFNAIPGIRTIPTIPHTNMFHVKIKGDKMSLDQKINQVAMREHLKVIPSPRVVAPNELSLEFVVGDATLMFPSEIIRNYLIEIFE